MPLKQKGFAHIFMLILLVAGIGIGIYLVQNPAIFKPKASESPASTVPQTPPTLAFVFIGESNSGGFGLNDQASPDELAKTSNVQILNNYSLKFEDLVFNSKADPSTGYSSNNILDHVGISDHPADHGLELQLAKSVKAGDFPNNNQVYLVKTGQGGSGVIAWNSSDEVNFPYWKKFIQRINAAKPIIYQPNKPVQWIVWYSLGLNDNLGAPAQPAQPAKPATATTPEIPAIPAIPEILPIPVADYKAKSLELIRKIKGELPGAIIILTQFQAQYQSLGNRQLVADYNTALAEIAASEPNIYVADSTGAEVNDGDPKHWSYAGFKTLGLKMVDITKNALQTVNTLSATPNPCILSSSGLCLSRLSWNFPGTSDLKIKIRGNEGSEIPVTQPTGSIDVPWITAIGATFDAYLGNTLIRSLVVKGVDANAPTGVSNPTPAGTISATNCSIPQGQSRCTSKITWSTSNAIGPVKITIKETGGLFANSGGSGSYDFPWVSNSPLTMQLMDGDNPTPLATVVVKANAITGQISATPCYLTTGKNTCDSTITWSTSNAIGPVKITIKETGGLFASGNSGSQIAPWVSRTPLTMQLMDGDNTTPLATVEVKASPLITASPNPCKLSNGKCTSRITWNAPGIADFNIYLTVNNIVFDRRNAGYLDVPFVTANGAIFQARSGDTVLDTVVLKGE